MVTESASSSKQISFRWRDVGLVCFLSWVVHQALQTISNDGLTVLPQPSPCITAFQTSMKGEQVDELISLIVKNIERTYEIEATNSTMSHHMFVRTAPADLAGQLEALTWNSNLMEEIRPRFPPGTRFIRDTYDEIYLARPEFDLVDAKKVHYDGNLKIAKASVCTVRALTYLDGPSVELVALTSQRNFSTATGSSVLIDFNRELHYPDTKHLTAQDRRIILKTAVHAVPNANPPFYTILHVTAHRFVFFTIKSLRRFIEGSETKSAQIVGMFVDNLMRGLNKIHMALPLTIVGIPIAVILLAPVQFPLQFLSYLIHIYVRCFRGVDPRLGTVATILARGLSQVSLLSTCAEAFEQPSPSVVLGLLLYGAGFGLDAVHDAKETAHLFFVLLQYAGITVALLGIARLKPPLVFLLAMHMAWILLTYGFVNSNAEVAHYMLLGPILIVR